MKKLLLVFLLMTGIAFSQQTNYTWGYTAAGVQWNQTGSQNLDSISTVTIVFDMQDYYPLDFNPVALGDSTDDFALNSTRLNYGTFWYRLDMENATDTSKFEIKAYPGNLIYHPNDGSRITASNINFSTTATALVTDTTSFTANDRQWTAVNLYLSDTEGKILPPEFIKVVFDPYTTTNDSMGFFWNFAYPALYESEQSTRSTSRTNTASKKDVESMH